MHLCRMKKFKFIASYEDPGSAPLPILPSSFLLFCHTTLEPVELDLSLATPADLLK